MRPTECGGVRRLASILRADPDAARASLPDALARYDPERPETVRALAFSYANSGFFAEALHISASNGRADRWLETLTAAVEGRNVGTPEGGPFRCGPAALLISLAAGQSIPALTPGDRTAVISFSSDLPDERKRDFLPSATDHLAKLGDDALAAELRALMPVEDLSPDPLSEVMETAKTILDAVDAGSADQTLIDNARLLLSELPSGEMRSGLEQGIAAALARQSEGLALAEHLKALPDDSVPDALSAAIKALSVVPEKKAAPVLAILLSWRERASTSDRTEAAEMLRRSNLSAIADQWSPHPRATAPTLVVPVIGARGPGQDWPGGDAGAGRASEDVRRLLAAHLTSEQETSPLDTINGARERLARARRSADLIERLLAAAPEQ
ncbi:hypothetical protein [Jannaschia aquimarina]|uniref:hypothetical protein n=1 Tax=Jannaschia aquimarina TaxID=935700 RepID=UPI0013792834|nr:hypothetical protein [Jannaschia aquimarina]